MRKIICLCVLLVGLIAVCSSACAFDYTPYTLERYETQLYLLHDTDMVAEAWHDPSGRTDFGYYITWFRDGEILRELQYDPEQLPHYFAAPHADGTCGILETKTQSSTDSGKETAIITLYDWTDHGLVHPRLIAEDSDELLVRTGGFSIWYKEEAVIEIFNDNGDCIYKLHNAENAPIRLAFDRQENIWILTPVWGSRYENNQYILRRISNHSVTWTVQLSDAVSVFPDQQGGVYCVSFPGKGSYKPAKITHMDEQGNVTMTKQLSANKVVIGCGIYVNPEEEKIVITGRAVANSRKIYRVYRMTLDMDWNAKEIDVRSMNYHNDYNLSVGRNLDGINYVVAHGIDDTDTVMPVVVPFDVLEKADNPGIKLN